jgi:hypothetical protein
MKRLMHLFGQCECAMLTCIIFLCHFMNKMAIGVVPARESQGSSSIRPIQTSARMC